MDSSPDVRWWLIGTLALIALIAIFALIGWLIAGREEAKLDDGDPNNPYYREGRKR